MLDIVLGFREIENIAIKRVKFNRGLESLERYVNRSLKCNVMYFKFEYRGEEREILFLKDSVMVLWRKWYLSRIFFDE